MLRGSTPSRLATTSGHVPHFSDECKKTDPRNPALFFFQKQNWPENYPVARQELFPIDRNFRPVEWNSFCTFPPDTPEPRTPIVVADLSPRQTRSHTTRDGRGAKQDKRQTQTQTCGYCVNFANQSRRWLQRTAIGSPNPQLVHNPGGGGDDSVKTESSLEPKSRRNMFS